MSAARKLAANVWVGGQLFEAGSSPEKEIAEQITNPKAWGKDVDESAPAAPAKKAAAKPAADKK